ncbi:MAG: biopolymer transporter ExbD [Pseudomonadota bacterium]
MARRRIRSASGGEEEDVNVTPLLDIVFIMLIFFIVTSTFIKEPGVDIERPLAVTAETQKRIGILVAITDEDEVWIDKRQVELGAVRFEVGQLLKEAKGNVVLQADQGASSRLLIEVLQQIRDAGSPDVVVSTLES